MQLYVKKKLKIFFLKKRKKLNQLPVAGGSQNCPVYPGGHWHFGALFTIIQVPTPQNGCNAAHSASVVVLAGLGVVVVGGMWQRIPEYPVVVQSH